MFLPGYVGWSINRSCPTQLLRASPQAFVLPQRPTWNGQSDQLRLVRVAVGHQKHPATGNTGWGGSGALVSAVVPGIGGPGVAAYRPVPAGRACHEGAAEGGQLLHYFISYGVP